MRTTLDKLLYKVQKDTNYNEWMGNFATESSNAIVDGITSATKSNKLNRFATFAN